MEGEFGLSKYKTREETVNVNGEEETSLLEAAIGIEPMNKGFADHSEHTLLRYTQ